MIYKNQILVFTVSFLIAGFFLLSTAEVGFGQVTTGACCANGVCFNGQISQTACETDFGCCAVFAGSGTNCDPPTCQGACCFSSGECVVVLEQDCQAEGGVFQGIDTNCEEANCPQPPLIPTLNQYGMIIMAAVLGLFAVIGLFIMRRSSVVKTGG